MKQLRYKALEGTGEKVRDIESPLYRETLLDIIRH